MTKDFILASASPQRITLLRNIGFEPKKVEPADIDESEKKAEKPTAYVKRMALEKAKAVAKKHPGENILAADTVVVVGTKILHKSQNAEEQTKVMELLSGRANRVLTAVCVIGRDGRVASRLSTTRVLTKKLSKTEIKEYVDSQNWVGSSGYKIEFFESYVKKLIGSYSGVVGLPLYETRALLNGVGVR